LTTSKTSKALFLDRDGVININQGYLSDTKNFIFIPEIFQLIRDANNLGYLVFIITNQSGIGRGFFTEEDFNSLSSWMLNRLSTQGANINKIYFSPFHPTHGKGQYLKDDFSRKPNPGMIMDAAKEFNLDFDQSLLVGDSITDIIAGNRAGIKTNLYFSDEPIASSTILNEINFFRITCLSEASKFLSKEI
jgi:D-glycero-D-manno-heptose 1,7-bisphosphate phosphatase